MHARSRISCGLAVACAVGLALGAAWLPARAQDAEEPAPARKIHSCNDDPGFHELDFWLGDWNVRAGNRMVGTNKIIKILRGCAIMENWTSDDGSEGKSLFYYDSTHQTWKQVWVTDAAYAPGGLKEKEQIGRLDDGSMQFQGESILENGAAYLDRTTLTPRRDGTVRQWIQVSTDGGTTWTTTFDAIYERKQKAATTK